MESSSELEKNILELKKRISFLEEQLESSESRLFLTLSELEDTKRNYTGDLAWRKLVEKSLRKSEELYRTLVENMGEGVAVVNLNEEFTFANARAEQIFDVYPGELLGKSLIDFLAPTEKDFIINQTKERITSGKSNSYEIKIQTKKRSKWLLITAVPYGSDSDHINFVLGIFRDISGRVEYEKKLKEYQNQLQSLASELTIAEERERRKIAEILHDGTGQNLALVLNFLKQFRQKIGDSCEHTILDDSINILTDTIKKTRSLMYDLSPPALYKFGLQFAIDELFEKFQENWKIESQWYCNINNLVLPDDIKIVLFQSVRELLINIAKYAQASLVRGYLHQIENTLIILIEDNGIGFNPDILTSKIKGRKGFGLFSIGERLKPFGGELIIDSEHKKGSRIQLKVPLEPNN